ncbi:hypothetical protein [Streptomyces bobili]|uniref:hypothetical protein n=1 Tax=Streptomyces bobili TaxID=67280 RepID=UPI0037144C1C
MILFACSVVSYAVGPDLPEARQIDLTVLEEKSDGSCRVRWTDPYQKRAREAPYQCDPGRSDLLKAPWYSDSRGYGWETAFMLTEGPERGNLEELAESDLGYSDMFLVLGAPLIAVGLVGGNLRALPRVLGVEARLVRRATRLSESAGRAAEDYEQAVAAVRDAQRDTGLPQDADHVPDPRLVTALWVLREAGPHARETAVLGRTLTKRLRGLLDEAAPAAGLRSMLQAGPMARLNAAQAVTELRLLLSDVERNGLSERFAQTSVDLLRGQDADRAALAAKADFAGEPAFYQSVLEQITESPAT